MMERTRIRGSSEEYGSWNMSWRSRRRRRSRCPRRAETVFALEADRAMGRPFERHNEPADRGLAAAGLAHEPEGLPRAAG